MFPFINSPLPKITYHNKLFYLKPQTKKITPKDIYLLALRAHLGLCHAVALRFYSFLQKKFDNAGTFLNKPLILPSLKNSWMVMMNAFKKICETWKQNCINLRFRKIFVDVGQGQVTMGFFLFLKMFFRSKSRSFGPLKPRCNSSNKCSELTQKINTVARDTWKMQGKKTR